jgi:uncharacterized repeat protein (TIGR01451 family)
MEWLEGTITVLGRRDSMNRPVGTRRHRKRLCFEALEQRRLLTVATDVTLQVQTATGDAQLIFNGSQQISGYEIDSASGQLVPGNFHSLNSQGNSAWSVLSSTSTSIAEGDVSGTLTSSTAIDLGDIFTVSGTQDLTFQWGDASGTLFTPTVVYVTAAPVLTVNSTHVDPFRQGDAADQYTVTVNNTGTSATSGLVTLTDTLPAGLTPTAATGTGWTTQISGSTVTATRSDVLNGSASYPDLTVTVSVSASAAASVTNSVQVTGGGATIGNNTASDVTGVTQVADLTISKSHTGSFQQGDAADNYTITVSNAGAGATTGTVTVTDTLPAGLTPTHAAGSGWNAQISGSTVTASRSDVLAAGANYPALTVTVSVANNATSVTNTAQVSGGGELNTANDTASDSTTITAAASDMTISASHSGNFKQGDAADTYTLSVSNIGALSSSGLVTITDTLPTGLTPTLASGTGWNTLISGSTVTATRSDALASGGSYPALTVTVGVAGNAAASVTNTATVAGGGELNTTNDSASDLTNITQVADLTISKSHTGNFRQGDTADQYTLAVHNVGNGSTSGTVTVTDTLPAGLTPTSATGTGWTAQISGSTVTATRSDALASGGSYPALTVTVSVADNAAASVTNTASVAGGGEVITNNDSASDLTNITQVADLTISKSHTGNFREGDAADNYSISVTNAGAGPTSGTVTVTDTLPTGLTPTAASGTGWTAQISGSTVTATRSDALAAGGSYPALGITVSVADNAPANVTNTASVAGGGEVNTANDSASDPTTITAVPDLTIAGTHTGNFKQGDSADTYSITVSNAGLAASSGTVTVTDTLPAGLTPTLASGTGWATQISGSTVTATRSDALAGGANYPALTVTVSVSATAASSVTNTTTVAGGGEVNTANDSSSDATTITQVANLTIHVSHTGNFNAGDAADTYTVTVGNSGSGSTSGVVTVTDTLPAGLTPTVANGTGWSASISGSTVTATRSDVLASGGSYPVLTVTVSVSGTAASSVTNTVQVAGGGGINTNNTASDVTTINAMEGSLAGYVYFDPHNSGQRLSAQGTANPGLSGVTITLLSQNGQGAWVAVSGKPAVQTDANGAYSFTGLAAGTYRVQITPPAKFVDGVDTVGKIGGTTRGTVTQDQIQVQIGGADSGTEYDFGLQGLQTSVFSLRMFLASTPPVSKFIQQFVASSSTSAAPARATPAIARASSSVAKPVSSSPAAAALASSAGKGASTNQALSPAAVDSILKRSFISLASGAR